jgi:selenocysteine lyase/cysteine desulfurase
MDLDVVRKCFPITKKMNYLNHAVVSPLSSLVIDSMNKFYEERKNSGSIFYQKWFEKVDESREVISKMLNSSGENLAFFQNTSHALNTVANIIPFKKGDEIAISDLEFPSNTFPWLKLRKQGLKIKWMKSKNGVIDPEMIKQGISKHTRVLALSHVCYFNGFTSNLKAVSDIAKDKSILLVIDATESLGALKIDLDKIEIDFLAANSYKWLLGPFGTTLVYFKEPFDRFTPKDVGWYSIKDIWSREIDNYELADDARRFEVGHPDFAGIQGLEKSVDLLIDFGLDKVEQRVLGHTRRIRNYLQELDNVNLISPEEVTSGITLFKIRNKSSIDVVNQLKNLGVIVFPQKWKDGIGIKVSPHFYNTKEEVDSFIDEIQRICAC